MNRLSHRLVLGLVFIATDRGFDRITTGLPYAPLFWLLYYGGAATVDLIMFHISGYFIRGKLQRSVQAICTAYAATNAFGYAVLILADAPPDLYNLVIKGLNYVLAIRLLMGDRNAMDFIRDIINSYRRGVVWRHRFKFSRSLAQKETR